MIRRENQPWRAAPAAALEWRPGDVPCSHRFGDVYFSLEGGPEEGRHVFLEGNDLPRRWRDCADPLFCVAETGFGTGLNFLLTWQAWRAAPGPRPRLHYLSIEKYPLARDDLARALSAWPELAPLAHELQAAYPGLAPGEHRLLFEEGAVTLDLWWSDVADALPDLAGRERRLVDAWYLDGFAPSRNRDMWRAEHFQAIADLTRRGGSFGTFTAAGDVRRGLADAGFVVNKAPGFGRKRECLRGRLEELPVRAAQPAVTPWDLPAAPLARPSRALVLGAGLAGCHAAASLARRGIEVTVLDAGPVAGAGSGNDQGVLYTRLSRRHSSLCDFALQSFGFAGRLYRQMFSAGALRQGCDGDLSGCFQQSDKHEEMQALAPELARVPELAATADAMAAGELLGIAQPLGGYWFPGSGWLHPPAVCRALLATPGITVRTGTGELQLDRQAGQWVAVGPHGIVAESEVAVIAAGNGSPGLFGLDWLPLRPIRGQTSTLPSAPPLSDLRAVLCHEGYLPPAREGSHCLGATFGPGDSEAQARTQDHRQNLDSLARAVPALAAVLADVDTEQLSGRVGFRCASPDYLPLAGPLPDRETFMQVFAPLTRNARRVLNCRAPQLPGLYLSAGHGSRGLGSAPLAAELIASDICNEPPPVNRSLARALAPARFPIRELGRKQL